MYACVSPGSWMYACKAHAPFCIVICGLSDSTKVFDVISLKGRFSKEKNVTEYKIYVLIFSTSFFEIFLALRKIQRDIAINVKKDFMLSTRYFCRI
jgi:hypothetical protein